MTGSSLSECLCWRKKKKDTISDPTCESFPKFRSSSHPSPCNQFEIVKNIQPSDRHLNGKRSLVTVCHKCRLRQAETKNKTKRRFHFICQLSWMVRLYLNFYNNGDNSRGTAVMSLSTPIDVLNRILINNTCLDIQSVSFPWKYFLCCQMKKIPKVSCTCF